MKNRSVRHSWIHVRLNSDNADGWPADYNLGSPVKGETTHLDYRLAMSNYKGI